VLAPARELDRKIRGVASPSVEAAAPGNRA
jgi:hypothetical protein